METALISVIVPVYNVAQYLEKIDSFHPEADLSKSGNHSC